MLPINDTEHGLWLTPSATSIDKRSDAAIKKRQKYRKSIGRTTTNPGNLAEQVQYGFPIKDMMMWRTPDAAAGGGNLPGIKRALDRGHLNRPSGHRIQIRLEDQVREPRLWPTPTARDYKGQNSMKHIMEKPRHNSQLPNALRKEGITGTLNPMWVEWLMGYPIGWTDLED
jgi:hypothetical protein